MDFFISNAYAQSASTTESLVGLLPLVAIFGVFYFLLIRPQQKRQKEHRELLANLKKGDEVATAGGLLGKIADVKENFVRLELGDNVIVTVQKHAISNVMPKGTIKSV
jgi:preprotein translocase subunit YajC